MKKTTLAWLAVAAWMGLIFILSSIPALKSPLEPWYDFVLRKLAHTGEYAALALLCVRALRRSGVNKKRALAGALGLAIVYAASDEWHQTFISGRGGSFRDVAIDAFGALLASIGYALRRSTTA